MVSVHLTAICFGRFDRAFRVLRFRFISSDRDVSWLLCGRRGQGRGSRSAQAAVLLDPPDLEDSRDLSFWTGFDPFGHRDRRSRKYPVDFDVLLLRVRVFTVMMMMMISMGLPLVGSIQWSLWLA